MATGVKGCTNKGAQGCASGKGWTGCVSGPPSDCCTSGDGLCGFDLNNTVYVGHFSLLLIAREPASPCGSGAERCRLLVEFDFAAVQPSADDTGVSFPPSICGRSLTVQVGTLGEGYFSQYREAISRTLPEPASNIAVWQSFDGGGNWVDVTGAPNLGGGVGTQFYMIFWLRYVYNLDGVTGRCGWQLVPEATSAIVAAWMSSDPFAASTLLGEVDLRPFESMLAYGDEFTGDTILGNCTGFSSYSRTLCLSEGVVGTGGYAWTGDTQATAIMNMTVTNNAGCP